jgi:LPXTG-motif cell wall-anchored protein
MKINKSFIRIALAVGLVGLAACGGSDSSSRNRNTTLEDGSICFTDVERAGLIEIAVPREQQDAVEYRAAIPAQPEVIGQPAIEARDAVPAEVVTEDIPAVIAQPAVPARAAIPDQPEVPARAAYWRFDNINDRVPDGVDIPWMANNGGGEWKWVDDHHVKGQAGWTFTLIDAAPMQPAIKGTPAIEGQPAVEGSPAYPKGYVLKEAIPAVVGQPEIKAQAAVAAQPEILARDEIKGATKEEVIEEINAIPSCPTTTVASTVIPSPAIDLSYESGAGSEKIAKLTWTPDAADNEVYSVVIKQNEKNGDAVSIKGKAEFTSAPLNPGCTDVGQFIVTRKSDDQLVAVVSFNYPDQDFTDCAIIAPEPTVPNEPTATVPDVTMTTVEASGVDTTEAPKATDAPAVTVAPVVEETAKTAIVTATATEVQLPPAAVEVTVKVEDVYTGFNVSASDVKSIEYQIDAGSWTAVTPGAALEIPKAASKMAIRVTKTNGEEVVSEKAIVRTEESTDTTVADSDTTMAPADTTAPVTTDAPESSSSNNILLYILGLVILAAIAGFLFKKKSASTK